MRYLPLVFLVLAVCFCYSEELENNDSVLAFYVKMSDTPTDAQLADFSKILSTHARFDPRANGISFNSECAQPWAFNSLGIPELFDTLMKEKTEYRKSQGLDVCRYRPKKKELIVQTLIPRLLMEVPASKNAVDDVNLRIAGAYLFSASTRYWWEMEAESPFTGSIYRNAITRMERAADELNLSDKFEKLISAETKKLQLNAATDIEKVLNAQEYIRNNDVNILTWMVLLCKLFTEVKAESVFIKEIPDVLPFDGYTGSYGILEEYVNPSLLGGIETVYSKQNDVYRYSYADIGENLLHAFLGLYFINSLMAGEDSAMGRRKCCNAFLIQQQFPFEFRPLSLQRCIKTSYIESMTEKIGPRFREFRLELLEEFEGGDCWLSGNTELTGEKGSRKIDEDFVFPHYGCVVHGSCERFFSSFENEDQDPRYSRALLATTEFFEWNERFYKFNEYTPCKSYRINLGVAFDYTDAGLKKLDEEGWIDKILYGHAKIAGQSISTRVKGLDRAVYYHFPKTRVRIYALTNNNINCPYSLKLPVTFVEVSPDVSLSPDKALGAFIIRGDNWACRTSIERDYKYHWTSRELGSRDWYKNALELAFSHAEELSQDYSKRNKEFHYEVNKNQNARLGLEYRPQEANSDLPDYKELSDHKEQVAKEIRELVDALPSVPSEEDKNHFWSEVKQTLKLLPIRPQALFEFLNVSRTNSIFFSNLCCISQYNTLFDSSAYHNYIDGHTYANCYEKAFFLEACMIRLVLEGDFETKYLFNSIMRDTLNKPDELKEFRMVAAFILAGIIKNRTSDLDNPNCSESYKRLLVQIEELDRKHGFTEYFMTGLEDAKGKIGWDTMDPYDALMKYKEIMKDLNCSTYEAASALNWLYGSCPDDLLFSQQLPDVFPAESLVSYNSLISPYVNISISEPGKNYWVMLKAGKQYWNRNIYMDLRVLMAFIPPVLNGEDAKLLRQTYFSLPFLLYGSRRCFQTAAIFATGKAKERFEEITAKMVKPAWERCRELQTNSRIKAEALKTGKVEDVWLPMYIQTEDLVGRIEPGKAYAIPAVMTLSGSPADGEYTKPEFIPQMFVQDSGVIYSRSIYENENLEVKTSANLPFTCDYDLRPEAYTKDSRIELPWKSPIPGLDIESFKKYLKGEKPFYTKVFMVHYPSITWTAYSMSSTSVKAGETVPRLRASVACVISPKADDIPDDIRAGMLEGSFETLLNSATNLQSMKRAKVNHPHLVQIEENESVAKAMKDCEDVLDMIIQKRREELQLYKKDIESGSEMWNRRYHTIKFDNSTSLFPDWFGE